MRLQVSKWGNSLAVRLPASYAKQSGVSTGDYLEARIDASGEMHLVPSAPKVDKAAMLKKIAALHKTLPRTTSVMDALRDEARY
jgi:antitoxin MazE